MKIAVNTRLLMPDRLEGIGWFTQQIFLRLAQAHPGVQWYFIFDRPPQKGLQLPANVQPVVLSPPTRHPVLWWLWFHIRLPRLLRKLKVALFISPDGFLALNTPLPQLNVIHDINFEHAPGNIPFTVRLYYRHYFQRYARQATRLVTVSQYSKQDIAHTYAVPPERIDVVYNGVGDFFHTASANEQSTQRQQLTGGVPYFIFIGAFNPRKNIDGMLHAYTRYRREGGQAKFVLVGDKMYWPPAIQKVLDQHPFKGDLVFPGRLSGKALNQVLAAAQALMFISHFEGFGIPIIEAFQCEVPVITSTTTSMPEVAGEAALLCEPTDYKRITEAMHEVEKEPVRRQLKEAGLKQLQKFNWDKAAKEMWQSIQKTLKSCPER